MISTEMVDCTNLASGAVIDVETKSHHYRIECHGGNAIRISGHPEYCPEPVAARLAGSVDAEGALEFGVIGRGMRLRFMLDERHPVTTSRIVHVRVDRPRVESEARSTIH
jgi:hypothetical protein